MLGLSGSWSSALSRARTQPGGASDRGSKHRREKAPSPGMAGRPSLADLSKAEPGDGLTDRRTELGVNGSAVPGPPGRPCRAQGWNSAVSSTSDCSTGPADAGSHVRIFLHSVKNNFWPCRGMRRLPKGAQPKPSRGAMPPASTCPPPVLCLLTRRC